jgi:hypothetical protein
MLNLILSLFTVGLLQAEDCQKFPVYCHILKNNPKINKNYAKELASIIRRRAAHYEINPFLVSAIFMQESTYNHKAKNCTEGLVEVNIPDNKGLERLIYFEGNTCRDFGIGQINYKTIVAYDLHPYRLINDLEYSVEQTIKILRTYKRVYGSKEKYWWTRYHSSTQEYAEKYRKDVLRWL